MSDAIRAHRNDFPIKGFSHIEFWVGNAYQSAQFYRALMGFKIVGYRGPETGVRDRVSYALEQGDVRFLISGGLSPDHEISRSVLLHGPGVHDVAFAVPDAEAAFDLAVARGAQPAHKPQLVEGRDTSATVAAIHTYGETLHSLVESGGVWPPPDFEVWEDTVAAPVGFTHIDHVVGNVPLGDMDEWVEFYERVFGFVLLRHFDDEAISTEYSALMSKVVWDGDGVIKMPINEPADGRRKSQIEEYLDYYHGAGVQHLAIACADLVSTVRDVTSRGLMTMTVPATYYDELPARIPDLEADLAELKALSILADEDDGGHLLQIFTRMLQDRPTLFFEFIERRGAVGFGEGNFKALFEAIERDQAARGNL